MRDEFSLHGRLLERLNAAFAKCLVALWPDENKAWGLAFAAESVAIDSPQKQFRWLVGGIPVLLRESLRSFLSSLGRPIGVSPAEVVGGSAAPQGRRPRTPRVVLALLLVFFVALFAQPATRAVFRSVSEAYTLRGWDPSNWSEVRHIQLLAEKNLSQKNRDSQLLAFASFLQFDEGKRLSLADAAIQSDPGLAWIDFQKMVLPADEKHPLSADRLDRLISRDPENAMLYLLRAESIAAPYRQRDAQSDPQALHTATWGSLASRDPEWLAAMDAAFKAPRYDAYDQKLFLLSREVMERYSVNDPRILSAMLGRRPTTQYQAIYTYAQILVSRSSEAQRAGNIDSAIKDCSLVLNFAGRLRAGNFYRFETWMANDIESRAYPVLQSLYENSGSHQQALEIASRIQQNSDERTKLTSGMRLQSRTVFPYWSGTEWRALLIEASVFSIWILVPASFGSIALLWLLRSRLRVTSGIFHRLLCLFADLCPAVPALASAVLFLAYAPVDVAYRQVVQGPFSPASYEEFNRLVYAPLSLPESVRMALDALSGQEGRFLLWSAATAVLILLVVLLFVRQLRGRRTESE